MEVLQLLISALKLGPSQSQLVPLGGSAHAFRCTTLLEISFAEKGKRDVEAGLAEAIDVLAIDAVDSLPLDIDEAWVAHHDVVIGQFHIDGHLFRESAAHGRLGVLRRAIDQLKSSQKGILESFLDRGTLVTFEAKIVKNELEFICSFNTQSENLCANV